ncbi:uroporphyrinogen-III synthase [Psychrobacillus lasiicapitis]|uniref:Uroporphyrinogen-III synthase n=1 Tax=Psychrobacillus lasiicapitis TaxID=1636719 RepID=A0A544T8P1_9BACI|nr:uroporphyrinogen-III synthase [Psychrobacillus lasiicapitis]TQR13831.1 uroporphyrinogen-III synthase [Psychrobacillus lasiicapitis]GGA35764.1 uroporphyrinogen-III synthase [Psychrobacillus lasiicapitis]
MTNGQPLKGEHVIFTGILRSSDAVDLTFRLGGNPVIAPLITTQEIVAVDDKQKLLACYEYDWFIFTSQSSVHAFFSKIKEYELDASSFKSKIAVVGSKTACAIESLGFQVSFTPTVFSADVFVQEFPAVSAAHENCLFFKGNLAKNTIVDGLPNVIDTWTIYETVEVDENSEQVRALLESGEGCSIIFTSPSTASVFHRSIGIHTGYDRFTICTIGHITKNYLESLGATVQVMPKTYTLLDVVNKLAEWKGRAQ